MSWASYVLVICSSPKPVYPALSEIHDGILKIVGGGTMENKRVYGRGIVGVENSNKRSEVITLSKSQTISAGWLLMHFTLLCFLF